MCIQHHPSRASLLPPLLAALGDVEVVTDPEPDAHPCPLRCYLECLRRTPPDATHRLVVQDDAILAASFMPRMLAAVAERPDDLLPLFVPPVSPHRGPVNAARATGAAWAQLIPAWVPTVALVWPVRHAAAFLAREEERWSPKRCGDDGPVGSWVQRTRPRVRVSAPMPSMVQHPEGDQSLIGRTAGRTAAWFDPT